MPAGTAGPCQSSGMADVSIRCGVADDLPGLTEIYNHYIRETPVTFDIEPFSVEQRRPWFDGFSETGRHRLLVAEREAGVIGWACSHQFRAKSAYDGSVETTVYLAPEALGEGIGARLYAALFDSLSDEPVHRAVAGVTMPNPASVALHRRFGFTPVGTFREVGLKFGRHWDVQWFEKAM
jgi:phosphinothricin acetyltransferase